jgi:hypothetical protein
MKVNQLRVICSIQDLLGRIALNSYSGILKEMFQRPDRAIKPAYPLRRRRFKKD